jgi:phospholipid/cholesterol/gamma-HCH transport system substrate-binding protein
LLNGGTIRVREQRSGWRKGAVGIAGVACAVALVGVLLLAISAGGSNGSYRVRAIFDDAGNIIPGEDVKIEGVKVGTVTSVTPTPQNKAAFRTSAPTRAARSARRR